MLKLMGKKITDPSDMAIFFILFSLIEVDLSLQWKSTCNIKYLPD